MFEKAPGERQGLIESLTSFGDTLVSMAHTRLDLLSTDLEEDREHFLSLVVLGLCALFCLGVGVVLSTVLLVALFWESHGLLLLSAVAGLFLAAGLLAAKSALGKAKTRPRLFASSLSELLKDRQQISLRS